MILSKYIFKDILKVQFNCFIVLFFVFMCQSIIKLLSEVSSGSVPVEIVSELVLYSMPTLGFIIIPLTLYIGVIVSLSRMSSDSEMVVMRSIGFSGVSFMKISLFVALISAIFTAVNCLYLMPKATQEQKALRQQTQSNPQYLPIESGKFNAFGEYMIYVQDVNKDNASDEKDLGNVYIFRNLMLTNAANFAVTSKKTTEFLAAEYGNMSYDKEGRQWLTLNNGNLYKTDLIGGAADVVNFKKLDVPMNEADEESLIDKSIQAVPTLELLNNKSRAAQAELQWRIAPIFACFIFAIIAVPLSMINPRQGRFARLGPAILIFLSYYLALLSMRNFLNSDKFSLLPGLYIVPVIFFLFVAIPLNLDKYQLKKILKKSGK